MSEAAAARRERVLVATRDADHRSWLGLLLRMDGFAVYELADGRDVVDLLFATKPGHLLAAICDEELPGMRGSECLAVAGSRSRFVILTIARDPDLERLATELGAVAVLRKPFDVDELASVMQLIEREGAGSRAERCTSATHPPSLVARIRQTADDLDVATDAMRELDARAPRPRRATPTTSPHTAIAEPIARSDVHPKQQDVADGARDAPAIALPVRADRRSS
jgi:DNA-binding response OmpR family regulator